jgi:hypothetical protein
VLNDSKADANIYWVKLWRFHVISDKSVKSVIFRDTDSRLSWKEREATTVGLREASCHIMHDKESHGGLIMAGMWGLNLTSFRKVNIYKLIDTYLEKELEGDPTKCLWNSDQIFLENYIWPLIKDNYVAHGSNKSISQKYPFLLTQSYPSHKGFLQPHETFIGQKIYIKQHNDKNIYVCHIEQVNKGRLSWVYHRVVGHLKQLPNVIITDNIGSSHIIIGSYESMITKFIDANQHLYDLRGKKFLVWCLEPKWSITSCNTIRYEPFDIHIMNCYSSNVYVSPIQFCQIFSYKHFDPDKMTKTKYTSMMTKLVVIATAKANNAKATVTVPGKNLVDLRYKLTTDIYNFCPTGIHIFGKGWPDGVAKQYTGVETQVYKEKLDILKSYYFNMCFENTCVNNYVTEKIWHSIIAGCLPIYYGNPCIYQLFPENSFVDSTKFKSAIQMFNFIKSMSWEEYIRRFTLCYDVVKKITHDDLKECENLVRKQLNDKIKHLITLDNIVY